MEKLVGHGRIFRRKVCGEKLKDRYKEHIYFTELPGRVNLVCFREMASYFLYQMKKKTQETKKDIVTAAAKIIKAELRELHKPIDTYPTIHDIEDIEKIRNGSLKAYNFSLLILDHNTEASQHWSNVSHKQRGQGQLCVLLYSDLGFSLKNPLHLNGF